jgi:hypothetical protein
MAVRANKQALEGKTRSVPPRIGTGALLPILLAGAALVSARTAPKPLFKPSSATKAAAAGPADPDTLEVYCLYVQFADETANGGDDEESTTGLGTFGSAGQSPKDPEKKNLSGNVYTLDPVGSWTSNVSYLGKHFEFARHYFEKVSNGRVTVIPKFFPKPDNAGKVTPIQLSGRMKHYNPSELDKDSKQKISDFNDQRGQLLMSFVVESLQKADAASDSASNPFKAAKADSLKNPGNTKKHRCFLIFHAGHSRLLDGGQLGSFGANTPNDFTDFFVTRDDFSLLDSATVDARKGGKADEGLRAAAKGYKASTGDTIGQVMMLSEAASQDKVNWGINGILVNQLARQMGMPDMFDVVKGISQLGFFDVMDFAGYNTLNGFLPVYPSAWVRAFMGWDEPVVAKRGAGTGSEYDLWSPTLPPKAGHATTLKVPINDREYFLVENRQRAAADSAVTIYYSYQPAKGASEFAKDDSVVVPFAKADSIFLDSLCDTKGKNCKPNPLKPKGIITGASSYDLGLPASGLLVWHVNEWFIEQFLKNGAVNAYLGDTLKSQYKGLELVEADGVPSIGKEFKDPLGQPAFDYGTGADMLPHFSKKRHDPPKDTTWESRVDTVNLIGPYGAASTNAWNDGRTHLRLEAVVPAKPLLERGMASIPEDSVFNVRDSALTLRVVWPDNNTVKQDTGWSWPVRVDPGGHPQSVNIVKAAGGTPYVVALSDRGYAQAFTAKGAAALEPDTVLKGKPGYDSVFTLLPSGLTRDTGSVPVTSLAGKLGAPIGSAVLGDTALAVAAAGRLVFIRLRAEGLAARSRDSAAARDTVAIDVMAGPLAAGDRFWVVTTDHFARAYSPSGDPLAAVAVPDLAYTGLAAWPSGGSAPMDLALAAAGGRVVRIDAAAGTAAEIAKPFGDMAIAAGERFTVSAADFDRDGKVDLLLLGSKGAATLIASTGATAKVFAGFPQRFPRSVHFLDTTYAYKNGKRDSITKVRDFFSDDASPPALADLDGDMRPDIVFSATNSVFAVDFRGAVLKGWPFRPEPRQNVGFAYGDTGRPETALRSAPLVLSLDGHATVLLGSPDGLIYAVDSLARPLKATSFSAAQARGSGVLAADVSDWPLTMGGLTLDAKQNPYLQLSAADLDGDGSLELLAQSGTGSLNVWTLKQGKVSTRQAWTAPYGGSARTDFLDVSGWPAPPAAGAAETIEEFHLFPSPVRGPSATVHLRLGAAAKQARIRVYDIAGMPVVDQRWNDLPEGLQPFTRVLDLSRLGADVYTALVEVTFPGGKKKKWTRFGVIR